jgi:hypothetical protein
MNEAMGERNKSTNKKKPKAPAPTVISVEEYTRFAFSPDLLANLKKVVSNPNVNMTRIKAVMAYIFVMMPYSPLADANFMV